ncbi:MAG: SprT-like domain-containing protein [Planctomycetota bacterium]|nr:SprT-like domain-containing protein [Planctomycetota bacterium]MDA1106104.1 SprT-like domain-containing protein [Planctomycetota bacterium]
MNGNQADLHRQEPCDRRWAHARCSAWWQRLSEIHGIDLGPAPAVELSTRLSTTAGLAISKQRRIKLSAHLLRTVGRETFDLTIAHEVAHVFVDLLHEDHCGHDRRWKNAMRAMGLPPARCHGYPVTRRRTQPDQAPRTTRARRELHRSLASHLASALRTLVPWLC